MSQTISQVLVWILDVAGPTAGVVGFAITLWQLKRARLEQKKLELELADLLADREAKENRIVRVTVAEIERFGQERFGNDRFGKDRFAKDWAGKNRFGRETRANDWFVRDIYRNFPMEQTVRRRNPASKRWLASGIFLILIFLSWLVFRLADGV